MTETRRFWLHVTLAALALILGCWLSSGTLTPYGTHVYGDCQYRYNIDHEHFRAVFLMLEGRPEAEWNYSVVLRRVLHPLLAYPFYKEWGFELGGFIFNIFSHVVALVGLAVAMRRFFDARASVLVTWLFASYPGYAYWVGLPYSYAFIVPGCIACMIGLLWLHERPSLARSVGAACVVGVIGLGYDLVPFFGGALAFMLIAYRRWRDLAAAMIVLGAWVVVIAKGLPLIFGFTAVNSNTQAYGAVFAAWLHAWNRLGGWGELLFEAPAVFISNFVFSGFVFFPLLLLFVIWLHARLRVTPVLHRVALSILLATLCVWAFLNLAPPYESAWQLRGEWIPRLYQPWFVAVLVAVAAGSVALRDNPKRKLLVVAVVATAVLDGAVIAGPFIGLTPLYATVHQRFYRAAFHNKNSTWLNRLGRRPYGICK